MAIANHFENEAMKNKHKPDTMYKIAVKTLAYDKGKKFEPKLAEKAADALEIAFKEFGHIIDEPTPPE